MILVSPWAPFKRQTSSKPDRRFRKGTLPRNWEQLYRQACLDQAQTRSFWCLIVFRDVLALLKDNDGTLARSFCNRSSALFSQPFFRDGHVHAFRCPSRRNRLGATSRRGCCSRIKSEAWRANNPPESC